MAAGRSGIWRDELSGRCPPPPSYAEEFELQWKLGFLGFAFIFINTIATIRGVAYDEDSLEYGDLCDDGCQVHNDGRIWSMAMWEERAALMSAAGPPGRGDVPAEVGTPAATAPRVQRSDCGRCDQADLRSRVTST